LPADYTYVPADGGVASFTITLQAIGSQVLQVNAINGFHGSTTVTVDPATGPQGGSTRFAGLFFAEADPGEVGVPSLVPGRKRDRSLWL
jgi:hypothetical protein